MGYSKRQGKGDYGWKAHNEKWICIGSGTTMRWPDSIHKKSDKTAAWVVQHSGTKIRHRMKVCFGWERWEAQTCRLEDYLAIPTHLLKSSLEWGKCTVCSFNSIPTAASQMAFASLWGCGVVRYMDSKRMCAGGVPGTLRPCRARHWTAASGVCTVRESGLRRQQKQIHRGSRVWRFEY